MFITMLFAVFSKAVAMLFAKSAPGIVGGFASWLWIVGVAEGFIG
jgi:hypothetical protein